MSEKCKFCEEEELEADDRMYIRVDDMTEGIIYRPVYIKYCPVCGRLLPGE